MIYFPLLDVLRFLAAVGVMCFHYFSSSIHTPTNPLSFFVLYGFLGVQLFFIISGFVIHFSLHRPTKEFAVGRFLRIYPIFWVICTITYIATVVFTYEHALPLTTFFKNLFIINNGRTEFMVDGSYWTLTIELLFYAGIGFFVWLFSTKRLEWFYAPWLILSLVVFYFRLDGHLIPKILLVRYAPYFIFGGVMAMIIETWNTAAMWKKIRLGSILLASALAPLYISHVLKHEFTSAHNSFGIMNLTSALIVEGFFILIPIMLYLSKYVTKGRLFTLAKILGGITYPLYLLHQRLGTIIIERFGVFGLISIYSILTACGMVIVSFVVSHYEEIYRKKAFKWIMGKTSAPVTDRTVL